MKTNPLRFLQKWFAGSLVFRTAVSIVMVGVAVGTLAALAGVAYGERHERARLREDIENLMTTVERTASIAAYAHDAELAFEVASGLQSNRTIAQVRILDNGNELINSGRAEAVVPDPELGIMRRELHSPFNEQDVIGELVIVPAAEVINETARNQAGSIVAAIVLVISAVTVALLWLVMNYVTRPIKRLSDELHKINVEYGEQVLSVSAKSGDEIGRLTRNVNALILRMRNVLSEERDLRASVQSAEQKWRLIFANAKAGIFTVNADGYLQEWNPWLADALGLPDVVAGESVPPVLLAQLLGSEAEKIKALIHLVLEKKEAVSGEFELRGDKVRWLNIVLTPLEQAEGVLQGVVNDISNNKADLAKARRMAEQDTLTGLFNRRGFERLARPLVQHVSANKAIGLLLIDLDGFKQVNDTYGHAVGDHLLVAVSRRIESVVRANDYVVRMGGDEFLVLLRNVPARAVVELVAGKIVAALQRPFELDGVQPTIGASVGAVWVDQACELGAVIKEADELMYQAKSTGKSRFFFADYPSAKVDTLPVEDKGGSFGPIAKYDR